MKCRPVASCLLCAGLGLAFSSAHPAGIVLSVCFPAIALSAPARSSGWLCAGCYYACAAWSLVPAARNFFGPNVGLPEALGWWLATAALLSLPWACAWTSKVNHRWWRCLAAVLFTTVPPVGLIGWASPLTASGYLFPGTSWFGILAILCGIAGLSVAPRLTLAAVVIVSPFVNAAYTAPEPLRWKAIDTRFGAVLRQRMAPADELVIVESIQRLAMRSSERVIVFPEAVVPRWNEATEAFWERTLDDLRAAGKTIIVGSKISGGDRADFSPQDLSAAISTLQSSSRTGSVLVFHDPAAPRSFRNVLIIRGQDNLVFDQRVPVPFGMWQPLQDAGVRLRLNGRGTVQIAGERAAVLICYEQLLTWPMLASMWERPTALIAVANDHWSGGTKIPEVQLAAVRAWARLSAIPYVSATNF
jgi:hypothetical protein